MENDEKKNREWKCFTGNGTTRKERKMWSFIKLTYGKGMEDAKEMGERIGFTE